MGIHSVAIYSLADKDSLHVQMADSAYYIGEAPAKESYLNGDRIIDTALACGAQAIHPGYGFLSENPHFAQACQDAGITFIGPSVAAMNAMASKQLAKQLLEATNVPLTPGYHGAEQSPLHLLKAAQEIGFPVLLKAANGGGGKGMRAVYDEAEFTEALAGAKREAMASFADDVMIIEKLVLNPRHIEVQIMADNHGQIVHLFERDCSIQRRHQKIIEEAPAPNLSPALREQMTQAACEVARSIDYRGAGTVEFLLAGEHFYFMEMNTRLQVEHPVTELITDLDLVAWQFKIAANEPLPKTQEEIHIHGHAIECRIYAEDSQHDFIPSIGSIHFLKKPQGEGIRIDTGVICNSAITMYYDPMIAKLIVKGENREEARQRLIHALAHYHIGGVKTNIPFLQAICQHPRFASAHLSTDFLSTEEIVIASPNSEQALIMTAGFDYFNTVAHLTDPLLADTFAWSMHRTSSWVWRYRVYDELIALKITPQNKQCFIASINEREYFVRPDVRLDELRIEINHYSHKVLIEDSAVACTLYTEQGPITVYRHTWEQDNAPTSTIKGQLTAPMPATIVAILKNQGDAVLAGEALIILEAMKMEHTIHAPEDGIIEHILYEVGVQVDEGAQLLSLNPTKQSE